MKRIHWWSVLGISGASVAALLLGQAVMGQPEPKQPLPLPPIDLPKAPAVGAPESDSPPIIEVSGIPTAPQGNSTPAPLPMPKLGQSVSPLEPIPSLPPLTNPGLQKKITTPATMPGGLRSPAPLTPLFQGEKRDLIPTSPIVPATKDRHTTSNVAVDVAPGKQHPAVTLEWIGPTNARVNQPLSCQIVVRNTSTTPVQNVVVRHRPTQGVTCKASEPQAAHDVGELVWNLGTLAPQQTRRIEIALVTQGRGTLNFPATVTFTAVAAHQIQVREPLLTVKMNAPEKVMVGENVTLLFAVSNPGDGVTEGAKVKVMLPDGLEHPRGRMVEMEVGNLAPKEIKTMQLPCVAKGSGMQKCMIVASADGNLNSNDVAQVNILMPKLEVALRGPRLRYLDRHAVYVLKITNPGNAPAANVEVQKFIPTGFKFHQANFGGKFQDDTRLVVWNLGEIAPGQSKDVAVDLIPIEAGEHRLVAHAKAERGLKSEADTLTTVEGLPSLAIEVGHGDDPIEVGAETSYEIRVANTGTKTETNVEVVCSLPPQLEFRDAKCNTTLRFRQEGRDLVFEPVARLAPRADVIFKIQVKGVAPGEVRFRTRIRADSLKEPLVREESMRIYSDEAPARTAPAAPIEPVKPAPSQVQPEPKVGTQPPSTPIGPILPIPGKVIPESKSIPKGLTIPATETRSGVVPPVTLMAPAFPIPGTRNPEAKPGSVSGSLPAPPQVPPPAPGVSESNSLPAPPSLPALPAIPKQ